MPSKNSVKKYEENSYYHVYNSGVEKREIFLDDEDYSMFLSLLERHLSRQKHYSSRRVEYETYGGRLELLAFNLAPTHFHLLFYLNNDAKSISELMRKVTGTYTTYFNKKYNRVGHLFQGVYKASRIIDNRQLLLATRYIHRNHEDYSNWKYSSLPYYIRDWKADWVVPDKVFKLYDWGTYESFLHDHEASKQAEVELIDVVLVSHRL